MNPPPTEELHERLYGAGVIAVLILDDVEAAVPVAKALVAGGVDAMELTLRTPVALECLRRIRREVPEMTAGVGTILTTGQVNEVVEAGAAFGVAPGMNPRTVAEAARLRLPFAPGICTPTDIELAVEAGCTLLKFFPAEPCGGLNYLKSISAPFAHLGLRYIPLGGVAQDNLEMWLNEPMIHAVGGSWLAPKELIQAGDWAGITARAAAARATVNKVRGEWK
ncbi:bifunctional 4-hydroxy-2-oxoglutarate aldolase/2-dehydro-3-deoxy-phosphogluconate aldolase [Verrucomicrobium spinosum]|uniref:bifunctional 4-hydroxy-2-oxoglutarate aldolase/2-dehydro-3-deoxy-phosphogluconate aldolase n=1 Tax=Verrucomicrobium spinosum TaxID=2736 RepID=UPI000300C50E|nr:bifunctional 4-hydroxy-2-oxoglutarate aldolase/2-dehydro-3-deoxy-phosphogluconate aldolase [Verrucomicrobium spinosum]